MITPASLLTIDPLRVSQQQRPAPWRYDPEASEALHRQAQAAAKARWREQQRIVRSMEQGAQALRDQEAALDLRRRSALAIAESYSLQAKIERGWAVRVTGYVATGRPFRHATPTDNWPRRQAFAAGCFDESIGNRSGSIELQVGHDGRVVRLLDGLNVCAVRNGIVFYGRIQHDDPGLATIKAMREVSPGYAVIETKADQYLNENGEETVHILRAALHELSFVPKSANPGSWFFLTDPREGVRS